MPHNRGNQLCFTISLAALIHRGLQDHQLLSLGLEEEGEQEHTQKLIFYNFETLVDEGQVHKLFLVCTKTLAGEEWEAYNLDWVRLFLLRFRRPLFRCSIFIAHNATRFDSYLIVREMAEMGLAPCSSWSKILCFQD